MVSLFQNVLENLQNNSQVTITKPRTSNVHSTLLSNLPLESQLGTNMSSNLFFNGEFLSFANKRVPFVI